MQHFIRILSLVIAGILSFHVIPSSGQDKQMVEPWKGTLADGTTITDKDLSKILEEHDIWMHTLWQDGKPEWGRSD
jgi:hypothetical protein